MVAKPTRRAQRVTLKPVSTGGRALHLPFCKKPYVRMFIPCEKWFHAEIMEFPGCYAQGRTVEEAYANLERAAEAWISAALSQGQQIPEPSKNI